MDLVGLVAVLGAFAVPLYALRARHEERKRRLELEAGKSGGGEEGEGRGGGDHREQPPLTS